jgi:hypothetical protein
MDAMGYELLPGCQDFDLRLAAASENQLGRFHLREWHCGPVTEEGLWCLPDPDQWCNAQHYPCHVSDLLG